jgi:hypothetical protein
VKDLVMFNPTTIAGDYSFAWKDAKGVALGTTLSLSTAEAGKYVFSAKDNKSLCVTTKQYEVKLDTAAPKIQFGAVADLNCNVSSVVIAPTIGQGSNFSYSWEYKGQVGTQPNFSTAAAVTVTNIGVYTLTVENKLNGCISMASKAVQGSDYPKAKMILNKPLLCNGDTNAEIAVAVTNGKPPYQYFWSNGIAGFSVLGGFGTGEHSVTVVDVNGCKSTSLLKITSPEKLVLSYKSAPPSSATANNGTIDNSIFGGTPPYMSLWKKDGVVFGTTQNLKNLGAGSYQVTVTDGNGCTASFASPIVYKPSGLHDLKGVLAYRLSPNPVLSQLTVTLSLILAQPTELYLTDVEGRLVLPKQSFAEAEIATSFDMSALSKGIYLLVASGNGNVVAERIVKD